MKIFFIIRLVSKGFREKKQVLVKLIFVVCAFFFSHRKSIIHSRPHKQSTSQGRLEYMYSKNNK